MERTIRQKTPLLRVIVLLLCLLLCLMAAACSQEPEDIPADETQEPEQEQSRTEDTSMPTEYGTEKDKALQALSERLNNVKDGMWIYRDYSDSGNHFSQRAKIYGYMSDEGMPDLDENWADDPHSGTSCIRCEIKTDSDGWGGWNFMTGFLPEGATVPQLNTGDAPGQGYDLTGARSLRFYARDEQGGEWVEFYTCGFGYTGNKKFTSVAYPGSSPKRSLGFVKLTDTWECYEIPLENADLSYVVCGFGFVCSGNKGGSGTRVFYLDDIQFTGNIGYMEAAQVLMRSYDTDNLQLQNTAFSYDNALAAMAFLSEGAQGKAEAASILDAFVYVVDHDRYKPGRVRNAYAAGDVRPIPGWGDNAALPGWYEKEAYMWYEDRTQVGCNVGNTSYVALALLQYDLLYGSETYRKTAAALMDWVLDNCTDPAHDGFIAGHDGWPENGNDVDLFPLTYKSIEHNIDAYAAFSILYERTGDKKYQAAAESALAFIESMYDGEKQLFYTGTSSDGVTTDPSNIVLDAQVWCAMALEDKFSPYESCLDTVKAMSVDGAYPFCQSNINGGWWAEGTAFTALMFRLRGDDDAAKAAFDALCTLQQPSGLFLAATVDDLSTGIYMFNGEPWVYGRTPHVAPTAWFIMAVNQFNPYSMDNQVKT